jgi:hypothetical protein
MKIKSFLIELTVSLSVILSLSFAANAAQQITGVKPLTTDIKINQSIIKPTMPPPVSNDEFKALLDNVKKALFEWDYIDGSAKWQQKNCAEKSYTAADQKAAGCLGTDTVDACGQKLYHHCMQTGMYHNTYMDRLNAMKQAVDNLNKKSAIYRSWLNEAEKQYQ